MMYSGTTVESLEASVAAAVSMSPFARTLRQRVLEAIKEAGAHGCTDEELQIGLGIKGNTERPRRIELLQMGEVVPAAFKRATLSDRQAVVWIVAGGE